jgi:hypothetical protein
MSISVVIASIPPRAQLLAEALASVAAQTLQPDAISVAIDLEHQGEVVTRNRALAAVDTEWFAPLDDDDLLRPQHLQRLLEHAEATGADLVYPWFDVDGGTDPLGREGMAFDPEALRWANYIPVTYLCRTSVAKQVGWYPKMGPGERHKLSDWGFLVDLVDAGARIVHLPERTWVWRHWGGNRGGATW